MVRVAQSLAVYVAGPAITTTAFTSTYSQFLAWFVLFNRWWSMLQDLLSLSQPSPPHILSSYHGSCCSIVGGLCSRTRYHYHSLHLHISSVPSMVRVVQSLVVYVAGPAITTTAFTSTYPQFLAWFVLLHCWWSISS